MIFFANRVGRLIEIRTRGEIDLTQFTQFRNDYTKCISSVGKRVVTIADMRDTTIKPDVFEPYQRMLKSFNPLVERTCLLLDKNSMLFMVVAQIRDGASNPVRKVGWRAADAHGWLDPVLDVSEQARMIAFLNEDPSAPLE